MCITTGATGGSYSSSNQHCHEASEEIVLQLSGFTWSWWYITPPGLGTATTCSHRYLYWTLRVRHALHAGSLQISGGIIVYGDDLQSSLLILNPSGSHALSAGLLQTISGIVIYSDDLQSSLLILNPSDSPCIICRISADYWWNYRLLRRLPVLITYIEPFGFGMRYMQDHCRLLVELSFTATTCSHRYLYWTLRVRHVLSAGSL